MFHIGTFDISEIYVWGVVGSAAVEVAAAVKVSADNGGTCPPPYNQFFYIFMRVILAGLGGLIPIALSANSAITALYLGASAPVFIDKARAGLQPEN